MTTAPFRILDPLFSDADADAMQQLCERFGRYGTYGEEGTSDDWGTGLPQRYDAVLNFIQTGGRFARQESLEALAARTNYYRETYAYGDTLHAPEIEPFHHFEGFIEAARKIHGRPIVRPAISYANLLVPGQELAVHTDVPEFRGMNRMNTPQWMLVAMHHSGYFDAWRMPIATAVAYFGSCAGGAFAFYPEGIEGKPRTIPARHNTAVVLDTDSVFHGVDRVAGNGGAPPALERGMQLRYEGKGSWSAGTQGGRVAHYHWDEIRFSLSWKAYCYTDESEECAVRSHSDDLTRETVVTRLIEDLRQQGKLGDVLPERRELALLMIDHYIQYPAAAPAPA